MISNFRGLFCYVAACLVTYYFPFVELSNYFLILFILKFYGDLGEKGISGTNLTVVARNLHCSLLVY